MNYVEVDEDASEVFQHRSGWLSIVSTYRNRRE